MKILHIIGSMDPVSGGPCQGIRYSNPEMIRLGSTREVVCLDDPKASFLGSDDFPIHALGPTKGSWQYTARLKPWLIENMGRFDVIVINGLWIYSSYAGWKVLSIIKNTAIKPDKVPKLFIMPHGMLDPYFQRATNRKLKAIRNWIYWKLIESRVVNDADGILFTCETELQLAREASHPYHPQKEINVGYGIVPPPECTLGMYNEFIKICPKINKQSYLLFLGRMHPKKGVDMLVKSYAEISRQAFIKGKKMPILVIAGPGLETSFGKKMIKLAESYPELKDLVLFPGMLRGDAKWGAMYNCDAFVLPSHQENFGIAVVEAMACQKPVLISNQINIWVELKVGKCAIVVPDTIEGTKDMLQQWLNLSPMEKSRMGEFALHIFKKHFHIKSSSYFFLKSISS
jgi:glycosyltransferase involved in cell wall biosynthesis